MKTLELHEMEGIEGGGFIGGTCAVVGFTGAALVVRLAIGMAINPVVGTAFGLAGAACFLYSIW